MCSATLFSLNCGYIFIACILCILIVCKHSGTEGLVEWVEDPSFPNTTLYNRYISRVKITVTTTFFFFVMKLSSIFIHFTYRKAESQKISNLFTYYVAVGNMSLGNMEVKY